MKKIILTFLLLIALFPVISSYSQNVYEALPIEFAKPSNLKDNPYLDLSPLLKQSDQLVPSIEHSNSGQKNYNETGKSLQNNSVESANIYYEKANDALKGKNYTLAIYNFDKALNQNPDLNQAYFGRGIAYAGINELDHALKDIITFSYFFPDNLDGHLIQARIYSAKQNFDRAIFEYGKTIELIGNEYSFYDERGWIYIEIGKYMEAMKDFNKVILLQPQIVDGYFGRSRVKSELNDNIGVINDLKKVLEINPEHSMANNNLGWSYFMKGNTKDALAFINKAILYRSDNYVAYDSRGEVKLKLGDYKGTINDSSKALELNPNSSNSYYIRAQAKYKLGDKTGACEDLSKSGELGNEEAYTLMKTYCQ
ncbi:MAG: tetratricopeptide repeat protein [Prolixibacteraceae bacterium]|nr:tetratricopeptide repeat protein [Prolixibacteraceae bacterium]